MNLLQQRDGLQLWAGAATDTGKVRKLNEDSLLVASGAFVVADGMGGHKAGDVASRLTIEAVDEWLRDGTPDIGNISAVVERANRSVREHAAEAGREGMGSTLVGAFIVRNADEESVVIVNVGDSRCYGFDGETLTQLTTDHSHVQELVDAGIISIDEAATHPERNVVTRAIGIELAVAGDFYVLPSTPRLRLLLCSDGVSGEISFDQIRDVLVAHDDPSAAASALIDAVLEGRAADNATAIVVDILRTSIPAEAEVMDDPDITGPRLGPSPTRPQAHESDPSSVVIAVVPTAQPASLPPASIPVVVIDEVPR